MPSRINESTTVPISLIMTALGGVIALTFWMASAYAQLQDASKDAANALEAQESYSSTLGDIRTKLERIDAQVQYIYESTRHEQRRRSGK